MEVKDIEQELMNEDSSPPDLAKYATILAGYYSYYGQMLKRVQLIKPTVWLEIQDNEEVLKDGGLVYQKRDKPLSDKKTERMWEATEDGQKEIALEWELKKIERMLSAIKQRLYVDNVAAKNNY